MWLVVVRVRGPYLRGWGGGLGLLLELPEWLRNLQKGADSHQFHTSECAHHWATAGLWRSAEVWQFLQAKAWRLMQQKVCLLYIIHAKGCVLREVS